MSEDEQSLGGLFKRAYFIGLTLAGPCNELKFGQNQAGLHLP